MNIKYKETFEFDLKKPLYDFLYKSLIALN